MTIASRECSASLDFDSNVQHRNPPDIEDNLLGIDFCLSYSDSDTERQELDCSFGEPVKWMFQKNTREEIEKKKSKRRLEKNRLIRKIVARELAKKLEENEEQKIQENEEFIRLVQEEKKESVREALASTKQEFEERLDAAKREYEQQLEDTKRVYEKKLADQQRLFEVSRLYEEVLPSKEIRERIESESRPLIRHYSINIRIDEIEKLRQKMNEVLFNKDVEGCLSLSDVLLRAAIMTMKKMPSANAMWTEDNRIRIFKKIDVNFSVFGEDQEIFAPLLRDAASRGWEDFKRSLRAVSEKVAASGMFLHDRDDDGEDNICGQGTFAVLNFEPLGIRSCAPVLPENQACLLAIGSPQTQVLPNETNKKKVPYILGNTINTTLVCDARMISPTFATAWINLFKEIVQESNKTMLTDIYG